MKLLIVTSIREDLEIVTKIMEKAGIAVFSVSSIDGHKTEQHDYRPGNWFGKAGEGTHSLFFFSFTEPANASQALQLIREHNRAAASPFPVRGFITPVEESGM